MPTDNPRLCGSNLAARYWLASSFKPPRPLKRVSVVHMQRDVPRSAGVLRWSGAPSPQTVRFRAISPRLFVSVKRIVREKCADFVSSLIFLICAKVRDGGRCVTVASPRRSERSLACCAQIDPQKGRLKRAPSSVRTNDAGAGRASDGRAIAPRAPGPAGLTVKNPWSNDKKLCRRSKTT
jgi:hypothetical protein